MIVRIISFSVHSGEKLEKRERDERKEDKLEKKIRRWRSGSKEVSEEGNQANKKC